MQINFLLKTFLAIAVGIGTFLLPAIADGAASKNYAVEARAKFTAKKYDEAIELYRKHLRRAPRDYNAWNQLGAAYYHTGQPRRALRYLKHAERKTSNKSYNYYYQGLCYTAVDNPQKAKEYFAFTATRYADEYGSRAMFEMAFIEYQARNKARAQYWLASYLQRFPTGVYRGEASRLLQSLQQGRWLSDAKGTEKPDMESALFKYNKLSLYPKPHYWYLQGGWQYADIAGQQPKPGGGLQVRNQQAMAAIANAGIGIGPWQEGSTTAFGGYTYRQLWLTDLDRINTYTEDPTDIEYFPLRGDLLERRHQFYGDFRRDIAQILYFGFFFRWEFARIGSTLFPSPDDPELRKVLKISDTQLFIPWIGTAWSSTARSLVYLYMRKEINEDSPDHSNKTYEFGVDGGSPTMSFGISNDVEFPEHDLNLNLELFQYEFIFNDYWLDYKRRGLLASAEFQLIPRWYLTGLLGFYRDEYVLPRIKIRGCSAEISDSDSQTTAEQAFSCDREDTGLLYQFGVYWNYTQFQRLTFDIQMVENRNSKQKEFDESKMTFQLSYTMAFPSVKRVTRFVDRYADSAFTKDPE